MSVATGAIEDVPAARGVWTTGRLAWLGVLLALAVLAALPSWLDIAGLAVRSAEHSHMLLVIPVALMLLWQRRERLALVAPRYSLWGAAIAFLGVGMDFAGFALQVDVLKDAGLVVMLVAAVVAVTGWRWPLAAAPAFGALLFLVPVPGRIRQAIAVPLQNVSASITEGFMDLIRQPIERAGNVLTINGVDVAVADACNGMRMVVALALVAYAFVFSMPLRPWVRIALLAASPLIALLANVVRLAPTVLFYGHANKELADFAHDVSGWAVLIFALGVLWGSVALLRWLEFPIEPEPAETR
jgi:exosortase